MRLLVQHQHCIKLEKGAFVEAGGRLFPTGHMKDNEPHGLINMQAQHVMMHVFAKKEEMQLDTNEQNQLLEIDETKNNGNQTGKSNQSKTKAKKIKVNLNVAGGTTRETDEALLF